MAIFFGKDSTKELAAENLNSFIAGIIELEDAARRLGIPAIVRVKVDIEFPNGMEE